MTFFEWQSSKSNDIYVSPLFWIYWAISIPLTIAVLGTYLLWDRRLSMKAHKEDEAIEIRMQDMKRNSQNQAVRNRSIVSSRNECIQKVWWEIGLWTSFNDSIIFDSCCILQSNTVSVPNSISVFKDTPHFTNTVCTFTYVLRRSYEVIHTARISYNDRNTYGTGPEHFYDWSLLAIFSSLF